MISAPTLRVSRRRWLTTAAVASGSAWLGFDFISSSALAQAVAPISGEFLGIAPFAREGQGPLDTLLGEGLDGRLYTDLSALSPEAQSPIVIPTERFYVRTRASSLLHPGDLKFINLFPLADATPHRLDLELLQKQSRSQGLHLLECAGNTRAARFGLLSAAEWSGVSLAEVLDHVSGAAARARILVSGFDSYPSPSASSQPGASWIFSREQIQSAGAFLATGMNGQPLPRDHGAPVRLVVPGWYGCSCIKWVNEIRLVADDAEPTSQMQEFALRTHQQGSPKLARDYQPAVIDPAAMPVRIEKWRVAGKISYRVIGILWGGSDPAKHLEIRFNPEENYVPVQSLHVTTNAPWTVWSHSWTPPQRGSYLIRLRVADPAVRTRRLDMGFYVREVEIADL